MPAVLRHWQNQVRDVSRSEARTDARLPLLKCVPTLQVVDEDETLLQFAFALRKQAQANMSAGAYAAVGAGAKGMKPKPKGKVK